MDPMLGNDRLKSSVTPSGVPFTVRNLKGIDQKTLSKVKEGDNDSTPFNEMLAGATISIGTWGKNGDEITTAKISRMLSNDRKFMLVTLRQHSLDYAPDFNFNYEWPLQKGSKQKEVQSYTVQFNHENFPTIPYWWMMDRIKELKKDGDTSIFDGHIKQFPVLYESYDMMLADHKKVEDIFPGTKIKFRYEMLDGNIERNYALKGTNSIHANTALDMRNPKYWSPDPTDEPDKTTQEGGKWVDLNTDQIDLIMVECLRKHYKEKEGTVDTTLSIQHQTNPRREITVDLVGLTAFFFPSQAI